MPGQATWITLALFAFLISLTYCQSKIHHSNESELIGDDDYLDEEDEEESEDKTTEQLESHKQPPLIQRQPHPQFQPHHQTQLQLQPQSLPLPQSQALPLPQSQPQPQSQALYNTMMVPNANVQPNPLRLPSVLNLPAGAPSRWVQPIGNGLPANPNLPTAGQQRLLVLPSLTTPPTDLNSTKAPIAQKLYPISTLAPSSVEPAVSRQWPQVQPGLAAMGALPGAPLAGTGGQRLIVLPSANKPSKQQAQITVPAASAPQVIERPMSGVPTTTTPAGKTTNTSSQSAMPTLSSPAQPIFRIQPLSPMEQDKQGPTLVTTADEDEMDGKTSGTGLTSNGGNKNGANTKGPGRIGVQTSHGKMLLEPHLENFCDIRQYSDELLLSKNLQRVEYFVANLTCSRYFFECAIGQTFLLNCTSKDQVFDINTVNCNFKYNVKPCQEYDHILHCSIQEECEQDHFACCAEPQQCIPYAKRCDGISDCNDGDDENNCPSCDPNEFPCVKSGKCISLDKRCNGIPDECFDQSNLDEQNCGGCPPEKFTCGRPSDSNSQNVVCIDNNLRCNGIRDCPKGEDELNCKSKGQKYLLCENQKQSVSKVQWCDGYEDCLDGSDEKYCVY